MQQLIRERLSRFLGPVIVVFLFAAALWALRQTLRGFSYADLKTGLQGIPALNLLAALTLTALNYVVLSGYDLLALKTIKHPLPYRRIALASFIGYVFTNVVGLSLLGAGAVRYRIYTAYGLSGRQIARVVVLCGLTLWTGLLTVAGVLFLFSPQQIPALPELPSISWRPLGALFLALVGAYLYLAHRGKPLRVRKWELPLPSLQLACGQIAFSATDWILSAFIFFLLLPSAPGLSFLLVLAVFVLAMVCGIVSHVPGGAGVFEAVVLAVLDPILDPGPILGALVAFRAVYYLAPLVAASVLLGVHEVRQRRVGLGQAAALVDSWFPGLVPHASAVGCLSGRRCPPRQRRCASRPFAPRSGQRPTPPVCQRHLPFLQRLGGYTSDPPGAGPPAAPEGGLRGDLWNARRGDCALAAEGSLRGRRHSS